MHTRVRECASGVWEGLKAGLARLKRVRIGSIVGMMEGDVVGKGEGRHFRFWEVRLRVGGTEG